MTERLKIALLLAPAVAVLGVLFLGGIGVALLRSHGWMPAIGLTEPGLDAYSAVLTDPDVGRSLLLTLYIAGVSTVLSAVLALGAALLLRRRFVGRRAAVLLFQVNLTVPHLVGAIGLLYLVTQSGIVARAAHAAGLLDRPADFPALVYDPAAVAIILTYVWKEVPFIGLVLLAQMQALGEDWEATARGLGATRAQAVRHVLVPLLLPGLLGAGALVFAFTFGAYEIPALLGRSHPEALPVLAWRLFTDVDLAARPEAMALSLLIAAVSALAIRSWARLARSGLRA